MRDKFKNTLAGFFLLIVSWLSGNSLGNENSINETTNSESSSIVLSLRFLMQNSHPKYLNNNGQITGLCGDMYMELKKRLAVKGINVEIPAEFFPIKRILVMLDEGRGDVYCGAGRNKKREKRFIYSSQPVYEVSKVVAARLEDKYNPKSFSDLAASKSLVGVLQGTSSANFIKSKQGVLVDDSFHSLDEALEALAKHKALRYFYYHDLGLNYVVKTSGLKLRVVPARLRSTPHWFIYSKKTPEDVRNQVSLEVTDMIQTGVTKQISINYLEFGQ